MRNLAHIAHIVASFCGMAIVSGASFALDQESQQAGQGSRVQFAVSVESVTLDVVVVDRRGRFVPGLSKDDFVIVDGGEVQDVAFFTSEFTPVTTLLLLDSSSSIRSSLRAIQTAGYLFAQNLSEGDTARIGLFSSSVRFGPRFTNDLAEHYALLGSMHPVGKTALYDAIIEALEQLRVVEDRRSLLVFTDGDDSGPAEQGSQASMEDALEAAKLSEVTIYTVGFTGWGPDGSASVNQPFLNSLAEATGGRAYFPEDVEAVKTAFRDVQEDLHRHYRMAYVPPVARPDDEPLTLTGPRSEAGADANETEANWRPLEVHVKGRDDLIVRTRQGYYSGR